MAHELKRVIWKYALDFHEAKHEDVHSYWDLKVGKGALVLSVQRQGLSTCAWIEHDVLIDEHGHASLHSERTVRIIMRGTGHPYTPSRFYPVRHIDTIQLDTLVFHFYQSDII